MFCVWVGCINFRFSFCCAWPPVILLTAGLILPNPTSDDCRVKSPVLPLDPGQRAHDQRCHLPDRKMRVSKIPCCFPVTENGTALQRRETPPFARRIANKKATQGFAFNSARCCWLSAEGILFRLFLLRCFHTSSSCPCSQCLLKAYRSVSVCWSTMATGQRSGRKIDFWTPHTHLWEGGRPVNLL